MGAWLHHWVWTDYYVPSWPNAAAVPLCAIVVFAGTYLFRNPLLRLWARLRRPLHDDLADIREIVLSAHRIAADTHKAVTGEEHPEAAKGRR